MHERIIDLYERTAAQWDAARGQSRLETEWLDMFLAAVRPGGTIFDLGCGSGKPAAYFVERGFSVVGADSSSSLIEMCRNRLPEQEWIVADMRALALGQQFDGVIAWHSFFHLRADDQRAMFPRFAAHAAPGAALMFTSGDRAGPAVGEWQGEALYHDSLSQEEYRALLAANGFEVLHFAVGEAATAWLARRIDSTGGRDGPA